MPNFDGTGPLKRGRAIGRGRGFCQKQVPADPGSGKEEKRPTKEKNPP